jgi:uncharacterized protein
MEMAGVLQDLLKKMIQVDPGIKLVYLFGSYADGTAIRRSDIDLAFLFDEASYRTDPLDPFFRAQVIAANLGESLRRKTDAVLLNSSSLEMAYEIVTSGVCVYEADRDDRAVYEARVMGLWFDFKPFVEELRALFLASLQEQERV